MFSLRIQVLKFTKFPRLKFLTLLLCELLFLIRILFLGDNHSSDIFVKIAQNSATSSLSRYGFLKYA